MPTSSSRTEISDLQSLSLAFLVEQARLRPASPNLPPSLSSSFLTLLASLSFAFEKLKYCNDNNIAVVPQGGNTGLVGGSIPVYDELILNLSGLNEIRHFDSVAGESSGLSRVLKGSEEAKEWIRARADFVLGRRENRNPHRRRWMCSRDLGQRDRQGWVHDAS